VSGSMTELEIRAVLDTHDALVRACLDNRLGVAEFWAAYGNFPASSGLDERTASGEPRAVLPLFRSQQGPENMLRQASAWTKPR
jgi:hypothetical protein